MVLCVHMCVYTLYFYISSRWFSYEKDSLPNEIQINSAQVWKSTYLVNSFGTQFFCFFNYWKHLIHWYLKLTSTFLIFPINITQSYYTRCIQLFVTMNMNWILIFGFIKSKLSKYHASVVLKVALSRFNRCQTLCTPILFLSATKNLTRSKNSDLY